MRLDFADSRFVNSFKFSLLTMSPGPDEGASVQSKSKRKTRKGKERADPDNHAAAEQHPAGETVNAAQQLIPPWAWTILADSDASGCPPVFDRDAKCVFLAFFAAQILIFRQVLLRCIVLFRQNILCRYYASCLHPSHPVLQRALGINYAKDHWSSYQSTKSVPTHYCFLGRSCSHLGFS